jgi:hypothetical protein
MSCYNEPKTEHCLSDADLDEVAGGFAMGLGFATGIGFSTHNPVSRGGTGFSTYNPVSRGGTGFSTFNPISKGYPAPGIRH